MADDTSPENQANKGLANNTAIGGSSNTATLYTNMFSGEFAKAVGVGFGIQGAMRSFSGISSLGPSTRGTDFFGLPKKEEDEEEDAQYVLARIAASENKSDFIGGFVNFLKTLMEVRETGYQRDIAIAQARQTQLTGEISTLTTQIVDGTSNPEEARTYLNHHQAVLATEDQIRFHPAFQRLGALQQAAAFDYTAAMKEAENASPAQSLAIGQRNLEQAGILTVNVDGFDRVVFCDESDQLFTLINGQRDTESVKDIQANEGLEPVRIPVSFTQADMVSQLMRVGYASVYETSLNRFLNAPDSAETQDLTIIQEEIELRELVAKRNEIAHEREQLENIADEIAPEDMEALEVLWEEERTLNKEIMERREALEINKAISDLAQQDQFQNALELNIHTTEDGQRYINQTVLERIIDECVSQNDISPAILSGVKEQIIAHLEKTGLSVNTSLDANVSAPRETGSFANKDNPENSGLQKEFVGTVTQETTPETPSVTPAKEPKVTRDSIGSNMPAPDIDETPTDETQPDTALDNEG